MDAIVQETNIVVELSILRKKGVLISAEISGVSMFARRAQFAEFGVGEGGEQVRRYTPGSKYLIPKPDVERLRSAEVRLREAVNKYSYGEVQGFKPYRWLPWTSYDAFRSRWQKLHDEFVAAKNEIIDKYDLYRDAIADEFSRSARMAWTSVMAQGYTALIYKGRGFYDSNAFIDAVIEDAILAFPTLDKIQCELRADYRIGTITVSDAEAELETLRLQREAAEAARRAAKLQEGAAQEAYNHQLRMMQLEQQEKALRVEAMFRAEAEHAKAQLEVMRSPFEEVFTALRQQIAADCQSILVSIQKNGFLKGKVAEKASGLVELYNLLAVHDDKKLREKLVELRSAIGAIGDRNRDEKRDVGSIKDALEEIITLSHKVAEDIESCRAAFLEADV